LPRIGTLLHSEVAGKVLNATAATERTMGTEADFDSQAGRALFLPHTKYLGCYKGFPGQRPMEALFPLSFRASVTFCGTPIFLGTRLPYQNMNLSSDRSADPSAALRRKTFPGKVRGTADPSAALGMTKERAALHWRAVARQKVFFIALGGPKGPWPLGMTKGRATLPWRAVAGPKVFIISLGGPQAHKPLGVTKGRVVLPCASGAWWREQQVPPLRCASVGMTIHILLGVREPKKNCPPDKSHKLRAKPGDLRCCGPSWECFSTERSRGICTSLIPHQRLTEAPRSLVSYLGPSSLPVTRSMRHVRAPKFATSPLPER
jgi:hypothetical protein